MWSNLNSKEANLGKRCYVCLWNFHLSKNATVNGHGSFVNLICTVTFVSQVLPRLLREATRGNTWDWHPPFLFFTLDNNSPKRAWKSWIWWHASLFCIPKLCILETIQYFLSNKTQVITNLYIWHCNENRDVLISCKWMLSLPWALRQAFLMPEGWYEYLILVYIPSPERSINHVRNRRIQKPVWNLVDS